MCEVHFLFFPPLYMYVHIQYTYAWNFAGPELAGAHPTGYFIIIIIVVLFLFATKRLLNRKLRSTNNDYHIYIKIIYRRLCITDILHVTTIHTTTI